MLGQEWPAEDYAIGSYLQATIAAQYLNYLTIKPTDHVLDIGCGNGSFSRKIIEKVPQGTFLGLDPSENMLKLTQKEWAAFPNASAHHNNVLSMKFNQQFDYIVSFWCLHWCALDLEQAFKNIYNALKPGGKVLALLGTGEGSFMTSVDAVRKSGAFTCLNSFKPPIDSRYLQNVPERVQTIPFKQITVEEIKHKILLPSLELFRKFVNGLAFFHGQIPTDKISTINEAVVDAFAQACHDQYQDEYWFTISIFLIKAEK